MRILNTASHGAKAGRTNQIRTLAFLIALMALHLSATLRIGAQSESSPGVVRPTPSKVVILPPQVELEELPSGWNGAGFGAIPMGRSQPAGGNFDSTLADNASAHLSDRHYTVVAADALKDASAGDLLKQLEPLRSRLARGAVNDEAQSILDRLAESSDDYLLFVQIVKIKNGPGGSWNPNTGAITSRLASTLVQAALISPHTHQVIWKSEEFERKVLRPDDARFQKLLDQLYQTLTQPGGKS